MPTCIEYLLHVHGMSLSGITRHFLAQHQIKKDHKKKMRWEEIYIKTYRGKPVLNFLKTIWNGRVTKVHVQYVYMHVQ